MKIERVAVAGGDLLCSYTGPDQTSGPALVLLHGWTLDHRQWRAQLEALADDRLVLAPDRRGFGYSTAPPDLAREAEDIVTLLDHFAIQGAIVLGMSQAGRVALDFALRFSERCAGLILQGAPASGVTPGPTEDELIPIVEYARYARENRLDDMKRRWKRHPLMRVNDEAAQLLLEIMLADYRGLDLNAVSYLKDADAQDLARITAPTLIMTGEHETPWRQRAAHYLATHIPNAEHITIQGAGHAPNLDQPNAFNATVRSFLAARTAP